MDTFVLRIWTPAPVAGDSGAMPQGTHGTAHHVVSGRSGVFRTEDQLLRLLGDLRNEAVADPVASGDDAAGDTGSVSA